MLLWRLKRLWWWLFGKPIGPITSSEIGMQVILTDRIVLTDKRD